VRTVTAPAQVVMDSGSAPLVLFIEMLLSTPLRLNTSAVNIDWNTYTWTGAGALGSVEEVVDEAGKQQGLRFVLSGVPTTLLSVALQEPIRNKPCTLWLGILDPVTYALLDAPRVWAGTLDQMPITQSGETCTIGVTAEHPGVTYARPKPLRYTDADQQRLYPGDTCLRFVVSQANHQDVWPAASFFRR
jgi:hypothetical protein